jgi:hypothetical protein
VLKATQGVETYNIVSIQTSQNKEGLSGIPATQPFFPQHNSLLYAGIKVLPAENGYYKNSFILDASFNSCLS